MTAPVAYNQEKSCLSGTAIKKDLSVRLYALPFYQIKTARGGQKQKCGRFQRPKISFPPRKHLVCAPRNQRKNRPNGRQFQFKSGFGRNAPLTNLLSSVKINNRNGETII